MSTSYDSKPWYIQKDKKNFTLLKTDKEKISFFEKTWIVFSKIQNIIKRFYAGFLALCCAFAAGVFFIKMTLPQVNGSLFFINTTIFFVFIFFSLYFVLMQIGHICHFFMEKNSDLNSVLIGLFYLQSKIEKKPEKKGVFVPELILKQFLQQVRIYASEKNYTNQKRSEILVSAKPDNMLNRRWNDVQDTLDEFDIYLANNPDEVISKLVRNTPCQYRDISYVFQEVAETAESTWRPKGVNIEHAIVVPLKSGIDDKLLRRLLAGPWRACAYLCIRGRGVVFSTKNDCNQISARWECEGAAFPDSFFEIIQNQSLSVNERIENAMTLISNNPKNSYILFGLISLIIWHDLAKAAKINFEIKQGTDGLIIKMLIKN